jgi:hypothetical protein
MHAHPDAVRQVETGLEPERMCERESSVSARHVGDRGTEQAFMTGVGFARCHFCQDRAEQHPDRARCQPIVNGVA